MISPVEHNDFPKLELPGLENLRAGIVLSNLVREKAPDILFHMETKQTMDEMRNIQADLHYDSMLAFPCVRGAGGLAML